MFYVIQKIPLKLNEKFDRTHVRPKMLYVTKC